MTAPRCSAALASSTRRRVEPGSYTHLTLPTDRTVVFSPFGLGILDLALGKDVYDHVRETGGLHVVDDFFHELKRYG